MLYTATPIAVGSETERGEETHQRHTGDQDENQTNDGDELCVRLPDGLPFQQDDLPDVAHNPEPQSSVR